MTILLTALLFTFVLVVHAVPQEIQSLNPAFFSAGIQGCISAATNADGVTVTIHNCNTENLEAQGWEFTFANGIEKPLPQQIVIFGDMCLDVTNGVNEDGTFLQIWSCAEGNINQQWLSVGNTLQWNGTDKCIDLTNGAITDGQPIQIWTCVENDNQFWIAAPNPDAALSDVAMLSQDVLGPDGGPYCVAAVSDANGAEVALVACINTNFATTFPEGNITWSVPIAPLTGQIKTFNNMCLDVTNGVNEDGTELQIWTCIDGNTNQLWQNLGTGQFEWGGTGKCIDLTDGVAADGTPIQIWDCAQAYQNSNQDWFFSTL